MTDTATRREAAQRDASRLQHQICFGVFDIYMKRSDNSMVTKLASALDVPYDRLQKMLTGRVVMQLEDIGRLRQLIGYSLDYWMLRGPSAQFVRARDKEIRIKREQQASADFARRAQDDFELLRSLPDTPAR